MAFLDPALHGPTFLADVLPGRRVRDLALVLSGVLATALLAQVAVPVPGSPVPITGQTLAVVLVASALGPLRGVQSQLLYVLLGAVGLPFYSEGASGVAVLTGATGGYLVGFLPAAVLIGLAAKHGRDRQLLRGLPWFVLGQAVVFAVGVPWLAAVAHLSAGEALSAGLYPFLLGGAVKAVIAAALIPGLWRLVPGGTSSRR